MILHPFLWFWAPINFSIWSFDIIGIVNMSNGSILDLKRFLRFVRSKRAFSLKGIYVCAIEVNHNTGWRLFAIIWARSFMEPQSFLPLLWFSLMSVV